MKRPQFSLRDLVWLILLCAVCLAWRLDHQRQLAAEAEWRSEQARLTKHARMDQGQINFLKREVTKLNKDVFLVRRRLGHDVVLPAEADRKD